MDTVTFVGVIYKACPYTRIFYVIDDEHLILK